MVIGKNRVPLQVSPDFKKKMKELKRKAISMGWEENEASARRLTELISKDIIFSEIERKILEKKDVDLKIKFDERAK